MGLENIGVAKWGDKVDEPDIPNMTTNDLLENNMNGYSETQVILILMMILNLRIHTKLFLR